MEERPSLEFLPSFIDKIACDLIEESGIQNCNRSLRNQLGKQLAKDVWEFAEHIGRVAENEDEVIQRIDEMENRDRQAKVAMMDHVASDVKRETKIEACNRRFDWISKASDGVFEGLLCVWNSKVFKKKEVLDEDNYIGVFGLKGVEEVQRVLRRFQFIF
ncbi:hypothetical protein SLEP1_g3563 [Rubroshorea leprosula]|uniref:Uncharacterized protein n=1 Tax=Rubroshorea leprosula TaxID=152421 RepID=A0AAV5HQ58_9ROSI|nr:hypothetical protein SLEP1_g3563 [Rubroshorea leprosula]